MIGSIIAALAAAAFLGWVFSRTAPKPCPGMTPLSRDQRIERWRDELAATDQLDADEHETRLAIAHESKRLMLARMRPTVPRVKSLVVAGPLRVERRLPRAHVRAMQRFSW